MSRQLPTRCLIVVATAGLALALAACEIDPDDTVGDTQTELDSSADADADPGSDSGDDASDAAADDAPDHAPDVPIDTADAADRPDGEVDTTPDADADPTDADDASDLVTEPDGAGPCAPKPPIDDSGPYVRVGVGFGEYEAVDNCDEVPIILGIQGGAHIWGAFEAGGFEAQTDWFFNIDFEFEQEGEVVARANYIDVIRAGSDPQGGPYHYDSVTVILNEELIPEDRVDIPGTLRLRLWREDVVDLRDEVLLVPNEVTF